MDYTTLRVVHTVNDVRHRQQTARVASAAATSRAAHAVSAAQWSRFCCEVSRCQAKTADGAIGATVTPSVLRGSLHTAEQSLASLNRAWADAVRAAQTVASEAALSARTKGTVDLVGEVMAHTTARRHRLRESQVTDELNEFAALAERQRVGEDPEGGGWWAGGNRAERLNDDRGLGLGEPAVAPCGVRSASSPLWAARSQYDCLSGLGSEVTLVVGELRTALDVQIPESARLVVSQELGAGKRVEISVATTSGDGIRAVVMAPAGATYTQLLHERGALLRALERDALQVEQLDVAVGDEREGARRGIRMVRRQAQGDDHEISVA